MCDNIEEGITTDHNIENFFSSFSLKKKHWKEKK